MVSNSLESNPQDIERSVLNDSINTDLLANTPPVNDMEVTKPSVDERIIELEFALGDFDDTPIAQAENALIVDSENNEDDINENDEDDV